MLSRAATSPTLLGRHLERADHLARILGVHVALSVDRTANVTTIATRKSAELAEAPEDALEWSAVLKSCFAFESYQSRYSGGVTAERVIECLLLDPTLPRSARFSAQVALNSVSRIDCPGRRTKPRRFLSRLRATFLRAC